MVSLQRVLLVFIVLWPLILSARSTSAQETKDLAVGTPLNSAATADVFEAPVRLTVDDAPLNADKKVMYISPTLHDVDGDGKPELIIGGVSGELEIHANTNVAQDGSSALQGDPIWGPRETFEDSSGKAIRITNW